MSESGSVSSSNWSLSRGFESADDDMRMFPTMEFMRKNHRGDTKYSSYDAATGRARFWVSRKNKKRISGPTVRDVLGLTESFLQTFEPQPSEPSTSALPPTLEVQRAPIETWMELVNEVPRPLDEEVPSDESIASAATPPGVSRRFYEVWKEMLAQGRHIQYDEQSLADTVWSRDSGTDSESDINLPDPHSYHIEINGLGDLKLTYYDEASGHFHYVVSRRPPSISDSEGEQQLPRSRPSSCDPAAARPQLCLITDVSQGSWHSSRGSTSLPDELIDHPDLAFVQANRAGDVRLRWRDADRARFAVTRGLTRPARAAGEAPPTFVPPDTPSMREQLQTGIFVESELSEDEWSANMGSESPSESMRRHPERGYVKYNTLGDMKITTYEAERDRARFMVSRNLQRKLTLQQLYPDLPQLTLQQQQFPDLAELHIPEPATERPSPAPALKLSDPTQQLLEELAFLAQWVDTFVAQVNRYLPEQSARLRNVLRQLSANVIELQAVLGFEQHQSDRRATA